uniref:Astacin domain-containing protein n=1 Tax=Steinernema glaseri TaxID=37863 RepID=A0A1I7Z797_9BILA
MRDVLEQIALRTCLTFKDVSNHSEVQSNESTIAFENGTKCMDIEGIWRSWNSTVHASSTEREYRTVSSLS